tara:strand:+ start:81 stop:362 length:282 start_codon:yes stop_codon:yes gene_type:complete
MNNRIDIELMESRIRLWREGDISDEDLALEIDYMVPELKRCYAFIDSHGLDEDIEHKIVIDLRECSIELLDELCFQAGVETGTKEEMIARLLE